MRPLFSLAMVAGALVMAAPVAAQTPGNSQRSQRVEVSADAAAAAETLFQEARTLVEKGAYAEACPKFAESQRLDPGIGTLLNLGDCFEKAGKYASAWATYREAIAEANRSGQRDREKSATTLAARVEPKLSRVVVRVPDNAMAPGLVIERDGQIVDRAQWGTAIPIDPGEHTLAAHAPKHAPWSTKIVVKEATSQELAVPALVKLPDPPPPPQEDRGKTQRTIGFIVGGVGLAGLAAGGVLGLMAMSLRSEARDLGCDDVACATPAAKDKNDPALTSANISTVLFVAGGVVAATGVTLVLTAPGKRPVTAAVRGTSLSFEGRF